MVRQIVAGALVTAVCLSPSLLLAKGKSAKPVVCFSYTEQTMVIEGENAKVAICTDRAKPLVLTTYTVTTVKDAEGSNVKAVVGYR